MKKINLLVMIAVITLLVYSCSKNGNKSTSPAKDTTAKKESVKEPEQKGVVPEGVWISDDDAKSSIEVKGSSWAEMYEGEKPETFKFGIGDTCLANAQAKVNPNGKYITVFDPDGYRCFYIIKSGETKLELSYVGRGNTLKYTRKVK